MTICISDELELLQMISKLDTNSVPARMLALRGGLWNLALAFLIRVYIDIPYKGMETV